MEITKQQLIDAFKKWNADYVENPQNYTNPEYDKDETATKQAEVLIGYLEEQCTL